MEHAYCRARELGEQVRTPTQLFVVLCGVWRSYYERADLQTAQELGEQLLTMAQRQRDPGFLVVAHCVLGAASLWLGEFALARTQHEQATTLYDPQHHRPQTALHGEDPGVVSAAQLPWALWALGYPDQARARSQSALTLAQEVAHPLSLALPLFYTAALQQSCREVSAAQERAEALIALSTEQGFPHWLTLGTILQGWALAKQGQGEKGIGLMGQGWAAYQGRGGKLRRSYYLALLADAYGEIGRAEEGLQVLAEALATVDRTGARLYEAELYRLKGELSLKSKQVEASQNKSRQVRSSKSEVTNPQHPTPSPQAEAEAEGCFLKAIEVAHKQQAKSWELRAVMSLGRLWQQQGKRNEARRMLAEIYGWFTEGFDTKDLQEAKALLEELA